MILRVTDKTTDEMDLNLEEIRININEFVDIKNHLWISSTEFEYIKIDLDDRIPSGYLNKMVGRKKIIPNIPEELTTGVIRLVGDLYPDVSAELRFNIIRNRDKVKEIIKDLSIKYSWESYV